ncbi:MAG: excisionase family DNA-binding protein [Pseudonocardiaceae bacterium]
MPPRNWLSVNHPAIVRQLAIKPPEGGGTVQKYLTVSETAVYLNTSERFVRRLVAERRIAFHHVGRHVRWHHPTSMSGCSPAVSSRSPRRRCGGISGRWRDGEQEGTPPVRQRPQAGFGSIPGPVPRAGWADAHGARDVRFEA